MPPYSPGSIVDRVRRIIEVLTGPDPQPGDLAVLHSLLKDVTEAEAEVLLKRDFDFEPLTLAIHEQFLARGAEWGSSLRQALVAALLFCGRDDEAVRVQGAS